MRLYRPLSPGAQGLPNPGRCTGRQGPDGLGTLLSALRTCVWAFARAAPCANFLRHSLLVICLAGDPTAHRRAPGLRACLRCSAADMSRCMAGALSGMLISHSLWVALAVSNHVGHGCCCGLGTGVGPPEMSQSIQIQGQGRCDRHGLWERGVLQAGPALDCDSQTLLPPQPAPLRGPEKSGWP